MPAPRLGAGRVSSHAVAIMQSRASNHRTGITWWSAFEHPSALFVWNLAKKVWSDTIANDCLDLAAQMSFFFVLSLFPFLIVIAAILGWLPSTDVWHNFVTWVTQYLPRETDPSCLQPIISLVARVVEILFVRLAGDALDLLFGFCQLDGITERGIRC